VLQTEQVLCNITKVCVNGVTWFLMRYFQVNVPLLSVQIKTAKLPEY